MGDELAYTRDFKYLSKNGFYNSILNGISISFALIYYPISHLISVDEFSLRIAGTLSTILLFIYIYFRSGLQVELKKPFITFLLCIIGTTGATIHGTNDSLFFLSYIVFIFETVFISHKTRWNSVFSIVSAITLLLCRPVAVVYIPIIIIGLILFKTIKKKSITLKPFKRILTPLLFALLVTSIVNYPRWGSGDFSLSYSDKSYTRRSGLTWTEWVYGSQKLGNENRLGFFAPLLPYSEILDYKEKYGDEKLPNTYFDYLTYDIPFIFRRIITSSIEVLIISIRYVGVFLLILPLYIFKKITNSSFDKYLLLATIIIIGIGVWATIWPGLIQHRWIYPFYLMLIFIIFHDKNFADYNLAKIIIPNLLLIDLVTIWSLWKWKIFLSI
jgi:hypothetical protein